MKRDRPDQSISRGQPPVDGWLRGISTVVSAALAAGVVMVVMDIAFLGYIARAFYDHALGPLRAERVHWPAAIAFYIFYVTAIVWVAVLPVRDARHAAARGGALGLFAYGVYELTNWAVIAGWPAYLVPVDVAWGVVLTGLVAASSHAVMARVRPSEGRDWMVPLAIRTMDGETLIAVWARRLVSVPFFLLLSVATWMTGPLWLLVSSCVDLALGPPWKWGRTRAVLFFMLYVACEAGGIVAAATIWMMTLGGRIVSKERYLDYNARLQGAWSETLLKGALRIFSMRLETEGQELASGGPFLLLVRHVSSADTVLAASVVANHHSLLLKYVIKRELLWDPCIDIVGGRLPNAFIERASGDAAVEAVACLGREVDARSAVLIYPEGTRFSPAKRDRCIERLRATGEDDLVRLAESMHHVLPPRTRGVLALLDVAPNVDLVVLAHVGFEGARTFPEFIGGGLVGRVVRARFWRIPAAAIPEAGREHWLFERWAEVDAWVRATDAEVSRRYGEKPRRAG